MCSIFLHAYFKAYLIYFLYVQVKIYKVGGILYSLNLDIMSTLILSIILFIIGNFIKNKVNIFNKFCIPSPVVGGLLFCLLTLFLKFLNICNITLDTSLMDYLISFFFTTVGISMSMSLVKKGGKSLIKYWILCGILSFLQNIIAVFLSKSLNINPLLGLMCGTISMEGGHGCSAAYGATIESLGVSNAISVGITASTIGLILAGILGSPVSKFLIDKYKLKPNSKHNKVSISKDNNMINLNIFSFLEQLLTILLCISLGKLVANIVFNLTGIIIPTITGCMLVSVLFRNINDKINIINLNFKIIDFLSDLSLGLFLTMALMSIDLFKLSNLFGPIIIIVICQAIFITLYSIFICFKVLGKDYDSAVMISGLIGHGLGATPTALANMSSISNKYGYSPKAFLVVPLVAAFLLDVFTMPCIILFINILG